MPDETDVLLELAIQHHVNKVNYVSTEKVAEALGITVHEASRLLSQLQTDGRIQYLSQQGRKRKWQPIPAGRY